MLMSSRVVCSEKQASSHAPGAKDQSVMQGVLKSGTSKNMIRACVRTVLLGGAEPQRMARGQQTPYGVDGRLSSLCAGGDT